MVWICDKCNAENPDDAVDCKDCKASNNRPYYRKNLEPGKIRDQFTIELNAQERAWLEVLKVRWDFQSDSKALKICLENAIISNNLSLSEKTWRYFLNIKRQRKSSFEKLPEPTSDKNAMQI